MRQNCRRVRNKGVNMQEFENSPEMLALKKILRDFFLGIIDNVKGAFAGFYEWMAESDFSMPPMLKIFGNETLSGILLLCFLIYIIFANVRAYRLFAKDKKNAAEEGRRIPEVRLLANIWFGGAVGAMIAMYSLRHKTLHRGFVVSAWFCSFVYLILFSVIFGFLAFWTFL